MKLIKTLRDAVSRLIPWHKAAPPERPRGALSSVLGRRLAVDDAQVPVPTWDSLGLTAAKSAAFEWQSQRQYAFWNEMAWLLADESRSRWILDLHGIIGTVGELVLASIEAEVEKATCEAARLALPEADQGVAAHRAVVARSLRFYAEGQANYLVVASHGLANLTLRTMALHRHFNISSLAATLGIDSNAFRPRSLDRNAWTSLTKNRASRMRNEAVTLGSPELVHLTDHLVQLTNDAHWADLMDLRNNQYHRWRGESPGVSGIDIASPALVDVLGSGQAVGIGQQLLPEYTAGEAVLSDVVAKSRDCLDVLSAWMPPYLTDWQRAIAALKP